MTTLMTMAGIALAGLFACAGARAQDPEQAVRKILDEVAQEMREIDRLLLSSGTTGAAQAMERTADKLQKLMDDTQTSQGRVVRGIEKLIEELQNMQNSHGQPQQGEPQQDRQQRQQGEPQDQQQSTRREIETPDMVPQQRGDQQQQQPQGARERNEKDPLSKGQNVKSEPKPPGATEEVDREANAGQWGNLPKYVQFLHSRGGVPEVPEKYRRLLEAYQKQSHATKKD